MQALQQKQLKEQELKELLAAIKIKTVEERIEHCYNNNNYNNNNNNNNILLLLLLLL